LPYPIVDATKLFSNPDFGRTWAIGALTGVARWLEFVALAIFAYELTRSPQLVALLAVLRMLPYVALGMIVGGLADALDRRGLLDGSLLIMIVVSGVMAILSAAGLVGYTAVAIATLFSGAFWTVDMPARRRLMVDAVGPARMSAALGFDNSTMHATRALGPLFGGLIYEFVGIAGIYLLVTIGYAACLLLSRRISRGPGSSAVTSGQPFSLRQLLPPATLLKDPRIQIAMGVTLVYNLFCFPFSTMVPVIAQNDFDLPHALVGAITACDGLGGMLGALVVGAVVREGTLFRFYFFGTLAYLVIIGLLSLHLTVLSAVPALLLIGVASAAFSATQYALIHVLSPPEMRGRATGLLSIFIGTSLVGHYHAGFLFERLGSVVAMQVMAAEGLAIILLLGFAWWRLVLRGR